MTTLAAAVGGTLAEGGIRHAFGVVGNGNILAVAAMTAGGVRYVAARHEGGAIAMADAYYRATGEVAVCTTTCGPGLTNLATGLAETVKHRSGVVLLCGDAPVAGLRSIDIDQSAVALSLGVRSIRVTDPAMAYSATVEALRLARAGYPVILALPSDRLLATVPDVAQEPVAPAPRVAAVPAAVDEVADLLASARNPLLLAGLGAWRSGAGKSLVDLGDRIGALLATTVMANGMFSGNPWSLGIVGGFSSPRAARLIRAADVVVAFGASLNHWTLHGGALLSPHAILVQVDVAATPAVGRIDLGVIGDASAVAVDLLDAVNARGLATSSWRERAAGALRRVTWAHEPYDDASTAERIDPRTLSLALAPLLPQEPTLVTDGGHFVGWPAMYWPVPDPAALVFTGAAFQSIGLGFAGAVGAAVGRPDRTTVVALGDGGALMGLPDLETLVRCVDSALVVIYDDAAYGVEVHTYGPLGVDVSSAMFGDTDFAGIARALGATAATVRGVADLAVVHAWRQRGYRGIVVLDCKVVPGVVAKYLADLAPVIRAG